LEFGLNDTLELKRKVLIFSLNENLFGVNVSDLTEVNRIAEYRQVEKGPDWIVGMINFHGKTTPILNLKCLLAIEPSTLAPKAKWLAIPYDDMFVCLAVDDVKHFMDPERHIIDEMPSVADRPEVKYIKCYARIEDTLVPVLDFRTILSDCGLRIAD